MNEPDSPSLLRKLRGRVGDTVRELRRDRRWTQAELAGQLGLSQGRLSEIEGGKGSLTAEQFLLLLGLFNVGASRFWTAPADPEADLQNALARLGARCRAASSVDARSPRPPGARGASGS